MPKSHRVLFALLLSLAFTIARADVPATQPSTEPSTQPAEITWDQAKTYIGKAVAVTGPVMGIHDFGGAVALNVGKDFPSPDRFVVYVPQDQRSAMPADLDNGKTIRVTGTLKLYRGVPEIQGVAANITIVPTPTTAPTTAP